jgi:glucosamine-phosphate N-acetyltransferase
MLRGEIMLLTQICIDELNALDLTRGFLETLTSLADVDLTFDQAVKVLRNRLRAGIHTYVARESGKVIGTVSLLLEDKFIHGGGRVGHIEDVAVHAEHQKQGIGAVLVQHATEQARKLGCYKAILDCAERLVLFYEQMGYHRHEEGMRIDFK